MIIRGGTVSTPIKPEKNLVKATNLTEEEKAQARENIGAMKLPDESDFLDFKNSEIRNVSVIEFSHKNLDGEQTGGVFVYSNANDRDENGGWYSNLQFEGSDASGVVLSGLHGGILDNEAATVGQVKEMLKQSGNGSDDYASGAYVINLVCEWDEENQREWLDAGSSFNWDEFDYAARNGKVIVCYIENNERYELMWIDADFAWFSAITEVGAEHLVLDSEGKGYRRQIEFALAEDFTALEDELDATLGNIETALDSIIAIQEALMGVTAQ